jgi:predicted methyltransferase
VRHSIVQLLLRKLLCLCLPLVLLGCAVANQQAVKPASASASPAPSVTPESVQQPSSRIDRPTSEPYTGSLSIFEDPKRDERLQVTRVMDVLGIKEGSNVADIGAGSGWFSVRAAKRVGAGGIIYAVDINSEYLKYIDKRTKEENLTNIRTILGKQADPLLPKKTVDAVLLLKTYHELSEPIVLLRRTREAMREGALLGIIDRNGKGDDHGIDRDIVIKEAGNAGFVLVEQHDFVKSDGVDYFLVFRTR